MTDRADTEPTLSDIMEAVASGFSGVENRLGMLEVGQKEIKEEMTQLTHRMGSVEEEMKQMTRRIGSVETKLEDVHETLIAVTKAVDSDAETLIKHEERIQHLEAVAA